jgi:glycopeptide antibiotics resistance protein
MDDDGLNDAQRTGLAVLLALALVAVAALTLAPRGSGWAWGSPPDELRWYLTGLRSVATMEQLVGNLSLLVVPAALSVLLWPGLGQRRRLVGVSVAAGATIELLQWVLPLGRVVSPLDAALNAAGAVAAGLLATHLRPAVRTVRGGLAR